LQILGIKLFYLEAKKKKKKKKNKRSNQTSATSTLQLTEEHKKEEVESTSDNTNSIEIAKKAWSDLHVSDNIIRSLVEQNFLEPTPIQCLTLPAAIDERLDIIGAAETVISFCSLSFKS
jgi:ATP-dependent RNA helicase DDX24/MAK5